MQKILIGCSALILAVLVGGTLYLTRLAVQTPAATGAPEQLAKVVEGRQIIEIRARGGYEPRVSAVKAGLPTTVRFITDGTFDCSSAVSIPSLKISRQLPVSGVTEIDLGVLEAGVIQGSCSMGMFPFEINVRAG